MVALPEHDLVYLRERGIEFECSMDAGMVCVILKDYVLPAGLGVETVELMLRLPPSWPDGQPDMFWTTPPIMPNGHYPAAADQFYEYFGRRWQRWSRHLAGGWTAGDDLATWLRIVHRELTAAAVAA